MEFSRQEGTFLTQGLNPGLPHCRGTLYRLSHQGNPLLAKDHLKKMKEQMVRCLGKYIPGRGNNTSKVFKVEVLGLMMPDHVES